MKIINFKKHPKSIRCHFEQFYETHAFDLELQTLDGNLIWQGWSIKERVKDGELRLQGPMIRLNGKFRPAVLFHGIQKELIQVLVRQLLKQEYEIDIPMPQGKSLEPCKIEDNGKGASDIKVWRVKPKKPRLKSF